jgi:hypothetical protein
MKNFFAQGGSIKESSCDLQLVQYRDNITSTIPGKISVNRNFTLQDENDNLIELTQKIVIEDTSSPVPLVENLPDIIGECSVSITETPKALDTCKGEIIGTPSSGLDFTEQGEFTITWTYADGNGNSFTQDQKVIVKDNTPPVPSLETLPDLIGECSIIVTDYPTAIDNCKGEITGTPSGGLDFTEQGEFIITWTYDDGNGSSIAQDQKVIIKDNTQPEIKLKTIDIQLDNSGNASISVDDIDDGTFDNCTDFEFLDIKISETEFTCQNIGNVTVTVTVTDMVGNQTSESVDVTVLEPLIPLSTEIGSSIPKNSNGNVVIFSNPAVSLGLPDFTDLTAENVPESYSGITYEWFVKNEGENSYTNLSDGGSGKLRVSANGDYIKIFKVVVTSGSGCIAEDIITVVSVEASCEKGGENKVQVCHIPDGNSNKKKTICVNANAVDALLSNSPGSFIGNCKITYRMGSEPELVIVQWNTSFEAINNEIESQSENWFGKKKLKLKISNPSYNSLQSGIYDFNVELDDSEEFELEEPFKVSVLVLDKPKPVDIVISNNILPNSIATGQLIGSLLTIDSADDIHSYSMEEHPDVELRDNNLIWISSNKPPVETTLKIISTDRAGQSIAKEIRLYQEIEQGKVTVYPNPASTETNIRVDISSESDVSIKVYDAVGRLVFDEVGLHKSTIVRNLSLQGLSSGLYYIQVKINHQIVTKTLIKGQ